MKNAIYKITLLNWERHNKGHKNTYKKIMLRASFCSDAKVRTLSMTDRWLFLNLIVTCSDVARDTVELSSKQLRDMLECNRSIDGALDRLKSLRILSYEKMAPKEGIERKKERKEGIPVGSDVFTSGAEQLSILPPASNDQKPTKKPDTDANKKVWEAYRDSYLERYKVEPLRNASVNAAISKFVKRVGAKEAPEIIRFYLSHKGTYYLQNLHPITAALKDAESLRTQWLRGKQVTSRDVKEFERRDSYREQIEKVEKGLI